MASDSKYCLEAYEVNVSKLEVQPVSIDLNTEFECSSQASLTLNASRIIQHESPCIRKSVNVAFNDVE